MWLVAALALALSPGACGFQWRQAAPGYRYQFPRDHFEHPDYRTEWWYYTGNLRTPSGARYGFELVFFRRGKRRGPADDGSAWRVDDLYLAHLALTDIGAQRFLYRKRLNRAGPGIAGASLRRRRVWNGNWSAQWDEENGQTLQAVAEGIRFTLHLTPAKPPVIHGENGISRKAPGLGMGSHYVSFTRLEVAGTLNGNSVTGQAWMDHEWFTHQLEAGQAGWDWFSVQLANNTELMLFALRRKDGSTDPYSSGTYVDLKGRARHLRRGDFTLEPLAWWTSAKTGARYPVRWHIRVPSLKMELEARAEAPDQELVAGNDAGPTYWEGAVAYDGTASGVGYLEMTGYSGPVRLE